MKTGSKKRITLLMVSGIVLLIVVLFLYTWKTDPEATVVNVTLSPDEIFIGDLVLVEIVIELPWYRRVYEDIEIELPDGLQKLSTENPGVAGIGLGTWTWRSTLSLQAYDFGPFEGLIATVSLSPNRVQEEKVLTVELPEIAIKSTLAADQNGLLMASELPEEFLQEYNDNTKWLIGIIVTVFGVVLLILYIFRREKHAIVILPKPWELAETALLDLSGRLPLEAEIFFVELTDIVRRYIEAVYLLPATEMTTPEFLRKINQADSRLDADSRLVLSDFLTAADMVKFARYDATQEQIEQSMSKAKHFVIETSEAIVSQAPDGEME